VQGVFTIADLIRKAALVTSWKWIARGASGLQSGSSGTAGGAVEGTEVGVGETGMEVGGRELEVGVK